MKITKMMKQSGLCNRRISGNQMMKTDKRNSCKIGFVHFLNNTKLHNKGKILNNLLTSNQTIIFFNY